MSSRRRLLGNVHQELIEEIYLIVVGLGFAFIIRDLVIRDFSSTQFSFVKIVAELVYFGTIYYFLAFDWVAYRLLIEKYPYSIAGDTSRFPQGRFFTDATHLIIMAVLIFLALRPLDLLRLLAASALFAAWHLAIVLWHIFARLEYGANYTVTWRSHAGMVLLYLALGLIMVFLHGIIPEPYDILALVALLSIIVVTYAMIRKQKLIQQLSPEPSFG